MPESHHDPLNQAAPTTPHAKVAQATKAAHDPLAQVIAYMQSHWPSPVKAAWQVKLADYPAILTQIIQDFTQAKTQNHECIRIAGLSGSGKTSQILPAVEAYCQKQNHRPVLVAARRFVDYHPFKTEIQSAYGEENLRKNTDEFSTIMMFLVMNELTKSGYDIILDVTLLDPAVEQILIKMLKENSYRSLLLMIATSPEVTNHFLKDRGWRHSQATEEEFIRATKKAMAFYAENLPDLRTILWSVYDLPPIYDGPIKNSLEIFQKYTARTDLPKKDDAARREAKINYLLTI